MTSHIALLGDSIFDNKAYTGGEPDVVSHLRSMLHEPWSASLHAVDGAVIADLSRQLRLVPSGATHLVISVGGNDALQSSDLLATPVRSTSEALLMFRERVERFESQYASVVDEALELGRETFLCTIYNGNLEPQIAPLARTALTMFNDTILRVAFERFLPVIDLRFVCSGASDYANPIEPSGSGGRKIAAAIMTALGLLQGHAPHSRVFIR